MVIINNKNNALSTMPHSDLRELTTTNPLSMMDLALEAVFAVNFLVQVSRSQLRSEGAL